jgi:hypothetical protein
MLTKQHEFLLSLNTNTEKFASDLTKIISTPYNSKTQIYIISHGESDVLSDLLEKTLSKRHELNPILLKSSAEEKGTATIIFKESK